MSAICAAVDVTSVAAALRAAWEAQSSSIPRVLAIAGSDPSGGAGIQADLKTFSALRAYGSAVLTSLTAQSTQGVTGIHPVPADFVPEQLETLAADVRHRRGEDRHARHRGRWPSVVAAFRDRLACRRGRLDPVMVADQRIPGCWPRTRSRRYGPLTPLADVITPNLAEAAVLLGRDEQASTAAVTIEAMRQQARALRDLGAPRVLLKGGHATGLQAVDVWVDGDTLRVLRARRIDTANTHGTGCTLSSAVAALVPQRNTSRLGNHRRKGLSDRSPAARPPNWRSDKGPGPVHHFFKLWR